MSVPPPRIDPTSPESVAGATFSAARRGFHPDEVRTVLRAVAAELRSTRARIDELEAELVEVRRAPAPTAAEFDDETATRLLGEETVRVLQTARESAAQIRARAEESASRILRDATEESARIRSESEVEAARVRIEAGRDAESELSLAKQQGREMVNEARAYRERVLEELTRRREAARQQIDQLVHGRDRLLQVFERARLVAVDVVSELEPLVEPDEYVDLSPTTGPVPLTTSSPALPSRRSDSDDAADADAASPVSEPADAVAPIESGTESPELELEPELEAESESELESEQEPDSDIDPEAESDADGESALAVDDVRTDAVDAAPEQEPSSDPESMLSADQNVIALFGGDRAPAGEPVSDQPVSDESVGDESVGDATVGDATVGDATAAVDRPDVDGLFARLRAEAIGTGPVEITDDTPVATGDAGSETVFERRDADLVPLIVAAGRKLKRVLADEQNDVLGALRNPKRTGVLLDLLPGRDAHVSRYVDAIAAELVEAHRSGARSLDRGAEVPAPDLEPVRDLVAGSLIAPLRDRLERADADSDGHTEEMIRSVRAVFREWKSQQIDDQLDDVLRLAHGVGVLAAATTGAPMCWAVDPAGPACPDAEDNALAGAVPAGDAYPTGHRVAPAHAGCRCLLVPAAQ